MQRLEVYLDSYNSEPFVRDFVDAIRLTPNDERLLENWIASVSGRDVNIEKNLKIEDVRHRKPSHENFEATSLRVKLVP